MSAAETLALLFLLSVGLNEQVAEGCTCAKKHPQQLFCTSDIVIRAKVTGKVPSAHPELTAYKIQTIETFKQLDKKIIQVIYSPQRFCGIFVEYFAEYLLSGHVRDGVVVVDLCDLVKRWDHVSSVQKAYLIIYQSGCVCEISPCTGSSCLTKIIQNECLIRGNAFSIDDEEALQSICLPDSDGFCRWQKILFK